MSWTIAEQPNLEVSAIHDERGYRDLRRSLAAQYDVGRHAPDIQIVDVDLAGNRKLVLHHRVRDGKMLELANASMVLGHLANLWGYEVLLQEIELRHGAGAERAYGAAGAGLSAAFRLLEPLVLLRRPLCGLLGMRGIRVLPFSLMLRSGRRPRLEARRA